MDCWKDARPPLTVSLVTTVDMAGRANASPKSWWTPVNYAPPKMAISVKTGSDTCLNILETGYFVLHLPPEHAAKKVLHTAKPLPRGMNELTDQGIGWMWLTHPSLDRPLPYVPAWPWFVGFCSESISLGDHELFVAQVGVAGGFDRKFGVEDVLIHRSRNVFVSLGPETEVEPY